MQTKAEQIGNPDLIILPGSKNTINDLKWLRKNGMEAQIIKCSRQDIPVFGICGGFQMLGNVIGRFVWCRNWKKL